MTQIFDVFSIITGHKRNLGQGDRYIFRSVSHSDHGGGSLYDVTLDGAVFLTLARSGFLSLRPSWLTLLQAGVLPQSLQCLNGIPNAFRYGLTALALGRIPNRMSTSCCVMTTLHLGRDDQGKENTVSPPFRTVSRFELKIGTSLLVWSA